MLPSICDHHVDLCRRWEVGPYSATLSTGGTQYVEDPRSVLSAWIDKTLNSDKW